MRRGWEGEGRGGRRGSGGEWRGGEVREGRSLSPNSELLSPLSSEASGGDGRGVEGRVGHPSLTPQS